MSPGVNLERGKQSERVGEHADENKFAYLNAGTRHLVPSAGGSIPSKNLLGSVAAPDGIINAGSSPDGGTSEFCPGVVVDRLAALDCKNLLFVFPFTQ